MNVRQQPVEIPASVASRLKSRIRDALSSCEPGWIAQAFWLPALMGSLALLFYVETLTPAAPESLWETGAEAEQTGPSGRSGPDLNHPFLTLRQHVD